ncbi:MAG: multiheme c-type cytochrome [Myxococcota bacterium]
MRFCWLLALAGALYLWPAVADTVGAEACKTCHPAEYAQWRSTGHAVALARLSQKDQHDRVCRSCHTMEPASEDPALSGVQCESCHGGGTLYAQRYVMKDKVLAKLLGLEDIAKTTCAPCHTAETPSMTAFDFEKALPRVAHQIRKADR